MMRANQGAIDLASLVILLFYLREAHAISHRRTGVVPARGPQCPDGARHGGRPR
jgi:hypothetical protein